MTTNEEPLLFMRHWNTKSRGKVREPNTAGSDIPFEWAYASLRDDGLTINDFTIRLRYGRLSFTAPVVGKGFVASPNHSYQLFADRDDEDNPFRASFTFPWNWLRCPVELILHQLDVNGTTPGEQFAVTRFALDYKQICNYFYYVDEQTFETSHVWLRYNSDVPIANNSLIHPGSNCPGVVSRTNNGYYNCESSGGGETWIEFDKERFDPSSNVIYAHSTSTTWVGFAIDSIYSVFFYTTPTQSLTKGKTYFADKVDEDDDCDDFDCDCEDWGECACVTRNRIEFYNMSDDTVCFFGRFDVLEANYDPVTGEVLQFAIDFELRCGENISSYTPGKVRYNSSLSSSTDTKQEKSQTLESYKTLGTIFLLREQQTYVDEASISTITSKDVGVKSLQVRVGPYEVLFTIPEGERFGKRTVHKAVGNYPYDYEITDEYAKLSGFHLFLNRRPYCYDPEYTFRIHEVKLHRNGSIAKLALDFRQVCPNFYPNELLGWVRFNSTFPPESIPVANSSCFSAGVWEFDIASNTVLYRENTLEIWLYMVFAVVLSLISVLIGVLVRRKKAYNRVAQRERDPQIELPSIS